MTSTVSVAIAADTNKFMSYSSGILSAKSCKGTHETLDHAVLAVGYGSEGGVDYWIVKNSWGSSWGEKGYIRMEATEKGGAACGIQLEPSQPTA
jgi:C1A family cysteine protease